MNGLEFYEILEAGRFYATDFDEFVFVSLEDFRVECLHSYGIEGAKGALAGIGVAYGEFVADVSGKNVNSLSFGQPVECRDKDGRGIGIDGDPDRMTAVDHGGLPVWFGRHVDGDNLNDGAGDVFAGFLELLLGNKARQALVFLIDDGWR